MRVTHCVFCFLSQAHFAISNFRYTTGLPHFRPYHNFRVSSKEAVFSCRYLGNSSATKPEIPQLCGIMPWDFNATQDDGTQLNFWFRHSRCIRISIGKIILVFTRVSIIFKGKHAATLTDISIGRWIVLTNLKMFHTGGSPLDPRCEIIATETDVSHELSTLLSSFRAHDLSPWTFKL